MGKSGPCNNLQTACSFLMKLATWIEGGDDEHFSTLSANVNFGCYGLYWENANPSITSKIHVFFFS